MKKFILYKFYNFLLNLTLFILLPFRIKLFSLAVIFNLKRFFLKISRNELLNSCEKKLVHFTSSKIYSIYNFITLLSKNIQGIEKNNIIKVKDVYFKNAIKLKPKNLGLTSLYRSCIRKIDFGVSKELV